MKPEYFAREDVKRYAQERAELRLALRSRPLTVGELKRVGEIGFRLLVDDFVPYTQAEVQREFESLLSIQQMIQLAATREEKNNLR